MASTRILIEVIGNIVIEFEPTEKTLMWTKGYLLVNERRLGREPRCCLLRVFLTDRSASHVGPKSLDLTARRKPRQFGERGRNFNSSGSISFVEIHGRVDVCVGAKAVEGQGGQRTVASINVQPQRLSGSIPVGDNGTLAAKFQLGIPKLANGNNSSGLQLILCAIFLVVIKRVTSTTPYPAPGHDALHEKVKWFGREGRSRTRDKLLGKITQERAVMFPLIPVRGSSYGRVVSWRHLRPGRTRPQQASRECDCA